MASKGHTPRKGGNPQPRAYKEEIQELPRYKVHSDCFVGDSLWEKGTEVTLDMESEPVWYLEPLNSVAKKLYFDKHGEEWNGIMPTYLPSGDELNKMAQLSKINELVNMISPQ